ncbi:MAG: recombinase family protein [bacterium]|nr:recombinase family protein [bacterium]
MDEKTYINQKKPPACLYLRVSTEDQNSEGHYGLEVQEERCRSFCESQGYSLNELHVYKDEMSGGLPVERRESLKKLFEAAARKEFEVVIVYKTDRLARNLRILVNAIHDLEGMGVVFRSVTEPFDTSTSFGKANLNLFGTFAEFEKEMIKERTTNGRIKAAKAGHWIIGVSPFGYSVDKTTKTLVLEPEQAKIVRKIFHWVVDEKVSLREAERRMNQLKIPSPYNAKYKKKKTLNYWHRRTIGRILTNEVYTGTFYYRKYKRPFGNLSSLVDKRKLRPREEWIELKTPPIITPEMFEATKNQLLKNREFAKRNQKREYLYSKIIYCGKCGYKMFSGFQPPKRKWPGAGGNYYHGVYRNDQPAGTTKRCEWCPVYAESRLEPIWECLKEVLKNPKNMFDPLEKYLFREENPENVKVRLEEIGTELSSVREKQSRVDELYINGQIDQSKYKEHNSTNSIEEKKLSDEATRLRQSLLTKKEKVEREVAIREAYEQVKKRLETISFEEKAKIIRLFIERVTLYAKDDHASVIFRFPSSTETTTVKLGEKVSSEQSKYFPLVLNIKTMTIEERRKQIVSNYPLLYLPKTLV